MPVCVCVCVVGCVCEQCERRVWLCATVLRSVLGLLSPAVWVFARFLRVRRWLLLLPGAERVPQHRCPVSHTHTLMPEGQAVVCRHSVDRLTVAAGWTQPVLTLGQSVSVMQQQRSRLDASEEVVRASRMHKEQHTSLQRQQRPTPGCVLSPQHHCPCCVLCGPLF